MCVQLVMKEFLSNIALLKCLHYLYLNLQIKYYILIDLGPQNEHHRMRLAGVIYYGQQHFTAQVILSDEQIWFHDKIETGRNLIYNSSIIPNPPNMSLKASCHCNLYQYLKVDNKIIGLVNAMQGNGPQAKFFIQEYGLESCNHVVAGHNTVHGVLSTSMRHLRPLRMYCVPQRCQVNLERLEIRRDMMKDGIFKEAMHVAEFCVSETNKVA